MAEDSDSDYVVEEYIRPQTISVPLKNDESADILGNFKDTPKVITKKYGTFPKEIFADDYDHDTELKLPEDDDSKKVTKKKSKFVRKLISKKKKSRLRKEKIKVDSTNTSKNS